MPDEYSSDAVILHCWEDGPRGDDDIGSTCMLFSGHAGPHDFMRDDQIGVSFAPLEAPSTQGDSK